MDETAERVILTESKGGFTDARPRVNGGSQPGVYDEMTEGSAMRERPEGAARWWREAAIVVVALTLAIVGAPAMAQDQDLPGRVGRLADFAGQVLTSSQDRPDEWEPIGINYPITSGLNLWVSSDGRAEVDYGGGQFRLAGDTNVHIARLDDRELTLFVAQGSVVVRIRVQDPGETTRIDTPNTQLALLRPGLYRVEVAPDRQATTLIVREGEGTVALTSEVRQLLPGQAVTVSGGDPIISDVRYAQGADAFDTWSASRDRRYEGARASAYVSRQMVGASDLDRYGAWQSLPEYGAVWFPNAAAPNWAPYSDGYWVDIGGWGPTWVDSAPWGYAPFHYGRWAFIGGRWGWCPGGYVARPVWAPALVAWYGGAGWGVGVAGGRPLYGWVPLGWREPYYPGWRGCSGNCWARYNRPYGVNVADRPSGPPARHVNLAVPGALSAVPASSLAGRAPVRSNLVSIPRDLATSAAPMRTIPQMRTGERQVPNAPSTPSAATNVPRAASTYARAPRTESTSPTTSRPVTPARVSPGAPATATSGTLTPPVQRQAIPSPAQGQRAPETSAPGAPGYVPRRTSPPPTEVPPQRAQVRSAPPQSPSSSPSLAPSAPRPVPPTAPYSVPSATPRVAPQPVAPVPSAPAPATSNTARSPRGGERTAPESPSAEPRR